MTSRWLKLWPWVAASVAIHAVFLFSIGEDTLPGSADREAVVEIALVSAKKSQVSDSKPSASTSRKSQAEEKAESRRAGQPFAPHLQSRAEPSAVASNAEMSDLPGRESRVRNHLERFKYYPASARLRGISGEVEVAFELDNDGQATMLKILIGSGYNILDKAALETVHRAEPFPASGGAFQFRLRFRAS